VVIKTERLQYRAKTSLRNFEKLRACRMAFEELGVDDGVIVARTDSLGASLTQKIPVSREVGDAAYEYNKWLEMDIISDVTTLSEGDVTLFIDGELRKPVRLPNGLYKFREGTGEDRVVEDCISSLTDTLDRNSHPKCS